MSDKPHRNAESSDETATSPLLNERDKWWRDAADEFLRRMAQWPVAGPQGSGLRFPGTDFDADFSRVVGPQLLNLITAYAYHVQLGICTLGDAVGTVMACAWQRGAGYMSGDGQDELHEWVVRELAAHVEEPPPDGVITRRQYERLMRDLGGR